MEKIKILLVEDHMVVRNGIKLLLDAIPNFKVIGDVNSGLEAMNLVNTGMHIDVIMTDLNMQQMDGMELIQEIQTLDKNINMIVLTMLDCELHVAKAFQLGAKGYLIKNVAAEEMIFCINHVAAGGRFLCEELTMKVISKMTEKQAFQQRTIDPAELDLTPRELEVLTLLGEGLTNLEISKKLFLSKRTIEGHRQNLIDKTKSKNTPALIKFAVKSGLIS